MRVSCSRTCTGWPAWSGPVRVSLSQAELVVALVHGRVEQTDRFAK
jgi:hypothetical protein